MLKVISNLRERAKSQNNKIVLPEGTDERVMRAADHIKKNKLVDIILLGNKDKVIRDSKALGLDLGGIEIMDPAAPDNLDKYSSQLYELRKHKEMTPEEARKLIVEKPVFMGALLIREKKADGFVAGAVHTTRDVARSALYCIGLDPKVGTMSSSFIMVLPDEAFGEGGVIIFADCGIVPDPSPKQLANIAVSASHIIKSIFDATPRVALLSFSTKGSGASPETEKIVKALEIVKRDNPGLLIDGELQADAALIPEVADRKAPGSPVGGNANVLVFPSLEAGNIAYKLTQRLAKARALGPLIHGALAPCSDLSRGCDTDDIIDITCVTSIRATFMKKGMPC